MWNVKSTDWFFSRRMSITYFWHKAKPCFYCLDFVYLWNWCVRWKNHSSVFPGLKWCEIESSISPDSACQSCWGRLKDNYRRESKKVITGLQWTGRSMWWMWQNAVQQAQTFHIYGQLNWTIKPRLVSGTRLPLLTCSCIWMCTFQGEGWAKGRTPCGRSLALAALRVLRKLIR